MPAHLGGQIRKKCIPGGSRVDAIPHASSPFAHDQMGGGPLNLIPIPTYNLFTHPAALFIHVLHSMQFPS